MPGGDRGRHDNDDTWSRVLLSTWYYMTSQWNFRFVHWWNQCDWWKESLLIIIEFSLEISKRLFNFHQNEYRNIDVKMKTFALRVIIWCYWGAICVTIYFKDTLVGSGTVLTRHNFRNQRMNHPLHPWMATLRKKYQFMPTWLWLFEKKTRLDYNCGNFSMKHNTGLLSW